MILPEIISTKKTGTERFELERKSLEFDLSEFWSWNQSNLIENRTRGILAEFIVKKALEIESDSRIEWDDYDLITKTGIKIEIKSAAYIQSWKQSSFSDIKFGIAPSVGLQENSNYDGLKKRWSDLYIFCLLTTKDQKTINPLDLDQWAFYVLETKLLDKHVPHQKTIGLNSLLKLSPIKCCFSEMKDILEKKSLVD